MSKVYMATKTPTGCWAVGMEPVPLKTASSCLQSGIVTLLVQEKDIDAFHRLKNAAMERRDAEIELKEVEERIKVLSMKVA